MKDLTLNIAASLSKQTTVEGNQVGLEKGAYENTLALSDLTKEAAEKVHTHDKHFITGGIKATGERAVELLRDNPEYSNVQTAFNFGNNKINTVVHRSKEVSTGPTPKGETPKTRTVVGYTDQTVKTDIGTEMKNVRKHIAAQAEREFK